MGSFIEFNDTLQLTTEQGFPEELTLEKHVKKPFTAKDFEGKVFTFTKDGARVYHPAPTRVFLAHNLNGKWLFWGWAMVIEQTLHAGMDENKKTREAYTTGTFIITNVYDPDYQREFTKRESKKGASYF